MVFIMPVFNFPRPCDINKMIKEKLSNYSFDFQHIVTENSQNEPQTKHI